MTAPARHPAPPADTPRPSGTGLARVEVRAPEADRPLVRALARRLSEGGPDAERLRALMRDALSTGGPETGGVLAALRRSPLVGADGTSTPGSRERTVPSVSSPDGCCRWTSARRWSGRA
jgi:hypothetical protein